MWYIYTVRTDNRFKEENIMTEDKKAVCKTCGKSEYQFLNGSIRDCSQWDNWQCKECNTEIIRESDGYSKRNGRGDEDIDIMDSFNRRLSSGFNMLRLNQ